MSYSPQWKKERFCIEALAGIQGMSYQTWEKKRDMENVGEAVRWTQDDGEEGEGKQTRRKLSMMEKGKK